MTGVRPAKMILPETDLRSEGSEAKLETEYAVRSSGIIDARTV
jgi:hypothetical protein